MKIWMVVEHYEDDGVDCGCSISAHSTDERAKTEVDRILKEHRFGGEDDPDIDWCKCCAKYWSVDGPFEVDRPKGA